VTERTRPATLEEVAKVAGLSRATVSRVINGSPKVSEQARQAVQAAVDELGYAPNRAARTLVTRRTDSIGLVVAETEQKIFGEPFFASLIRGASAALAACDVQLVLLIPRSDQDWADTERFLSSHVDGVLLVSAHADDPLLERLVRIPVPALLSGRPPGPTDLPYVDADNIGGARSAVEHLVERGRRTIATVAGPQDMAPGADRLLGYRAAAQEAGLEVTDDLVGVGDFSIVSGERAASEVLRARPDVDAIFAASDLMALGAVRAVERAGRRIPDDVAVVGFDDSMIAETARPPLTSVHQPVEEIGQQLIQLLLQAMEGGEPIPAETVLPTHLVVREST
jgi:DNA-binding LacI/PurR family transcriptional regulator